MSAKAEVLAQPELVEFAAHKKAPHRVGADGEIQGWNPEAFANEQIRGLVRRVFFAGNGQQSRHVVFSAAEPHMDVSEICDQVGQALARETGSDVAVVSRSSALEKFAQARFQFAGVGSIKSLSVQISANLWHVPEARLRESTQKSGVGLWMSCLAQLRSEFGYAVIHGPAAGTSSEAAVLGQLADGIILILGANTTRKATAYKIKQNLQGAHSRILGTVLSERRFPVPERIYRRL